VANVLFLVFSDQKQVETKRKLTLFFLIHKLGISWVQLPSFPEPLMLDMDTEGDNSEEGTLPAFAFKKDFNLDFALRLPPFDATATSSSLLVSCRSQTTCVSCRVVRACV
jgi:hypothetical protein